LLTTTINRLIITDYTFTKYLNDFSLNTGKYFVKEMGL